MYKAENGIILDNPKTPAGFTIQTDADILTALLYYPYFQTTATEIINDAILQAKADRAEYDNIKDLAQHLATNYI